VEGSIKGGKDLPLSSLTMRHLLGHCPLTACGTGWNLRSGKAGAPMRAGRGRNEGHVEAGDRLRTLCTAGMPDGALPQQRDSP